ncbi:MAG: hypothetical protein Q9M92_07845 [Enterobacterales bacterium]|nr:hypothetical protein [Enterobacterales bacterium]
MPDEIHRCQKSNRKTESAVAVDMAIKKIAQLTALKKQSGTYPALKNTAPDKKKPCPY